MTEIKEKNQLFIFGNRWQIFKLDTHPYYREKIQKIQGAKAVDFLGILDSNSLYFIEVKDFRGSGREKVTKEKLLKGGLLSIVAKKVKDSIACIVGAYRNSNHLSAPESWKPYTDLLLEKRRNIRVVIWMEIDNDIENQMLRQKPFAGFNRETFKQQMKWLTSDVAICSSTTQGLPDLTVNDRPSEK